MDEAIRVRFGDEQPLGSNDYEALFRYFLLGYLTYRRSEKSLIDYPGSPSKWGPRIDQLVGFSRFCPLLSTWVWSGRSSVVSLPGHQDIDLVDLFRQGLLSGTNPRSRGYWGPIPDKAPRVVEAADIALCLWLLRNEVWEALSSSEKARIESWLTGVNESRVPDNNWHLFPTVTNSVLKSLGLAYDEEGCRRHLDRIKSFHRGQGWFSDGKSGRFDYYNAWGFHYHLLWLSRIDPQLDRDFIADIYRMFARTFIHFFTPEGFPILGRSLCYRLAVAAPLVLGEALGISELPAGQVRRALNTSWRYFVRRGATQGGRTTQGYLGTDLRWLDPYSGPASCLWSLRSLVGALANPPGSPFWASEEAPLPVEQGDFVLELPAAGWRITGHASSGEVRIEQSRGLEEAVAPRSYPWFARWLESLFGIVGLRWGQAWLVGRFRPRNTELKYRLRVYSSRHPFCSS